MMYVLAYFVIGFFGVVLTHIHHEVNPLPKPPAVSYQQLALNEESRVALLSATLVGWPLVAVVYLFIGVVELACRLGSAAA